MYCIIQVCLFYSLQAQAIYQAREKLKAIEKAKKGAISADELIKYAHRISATNAVSAPLTWAPGKCPGGGGHSSIMFRGAK